MWGLMKYALDGFIDFAEAPLKFVGVLGGLTTLCSAVYFIIEFLKTVIVGKDTPGYASTICLILFLAADHCHTQSDRRVHRKNVYGDERKTDLHRKGKQHR